MSAGDTFEFRPYDFGEPPKFDDWLSRKRCEMGEHYYDVLISKTLDNLPTQVGILVGSICKRVSSKLSRSIKTTTEQ